MKILILSDHTGDKASAAAAKREAEYAAAINAYRGALEAREAHLASLRRAVSSAWSKRKIFSTLVCAVRLGFAHLSPKPPAPRKREADREEIVWASGNEGERRVAAYLSTLSDDWILVSGYRNAKGEIDQILLGPRGVFAIEVKFINGVVHCNGDYWWCDKYDRYGNLVETNKPITDRLGRSPSEQLNESADQLQSFLARRVNVHRIHRVIVFSHNSSSLGNLREITVDAVATLNSLDLDRLFSRSSVTLDSQAIECILQAIRKDHHFHNKPKPHSKR